MKAKPISTETSQTEKTHRYRVAAWGTSGRAGIVKADYVPSVIHFTAPPEFGGLEAMWTPEHLLLGAVASCFTATFGVIAASAKFDYTDLEVGAAGVVTKTDLGYSFREIVVHPTLTIAHDQERERALDLLQKAKTLCLVSRALATPQEFEMIVNVSDLSPGRNALTESNQLSKLAVRPCPSQYAGPRAMKDHAVIDLRPICPEDELMLMRFHETLSDRTVYFRYFHSVSLKSRVAHERLARICFAAPNHEIVLVADCKEPKTGLHQILGVGRLNKLQGRREGEVAILVSDHYQHRGLGTDLLRRLVEIAREEKLTRVNSEMLRENLAMQTLVKKLGFSLRLLEDPTSIRAFLDL